MDKKTSDAARKSLDDYMKRNLPPDLPRTPEEAERRDIEGLREANRRYEEQKRSSDR